MRSQRGSKHSNIPYEPLPDAAFRAVSDSFSQLGFEPEAIEKDYRFSSADNIVRVNVLAFAHPSQRNLNDYAAVTVLNVVNDQSGTGISDADKVSIMAGSSAPFHIIYREEKFELWTSNVDITPGKKKPNVKSERVVPSIAGDRLSDVLSNYADDLNPQRLINVKQGREAFKQFSYINPLRLSLWAESIRSKPLVQHFEQAIQVLRKHSSQLPGETITNIATQLLGLLILADTGSFGQAIRLNRPPLSKLIDEAYNKFPHYFDKWLLLNKYSDAVKCAYEVLQNVQYAGFVPDMLGDLYAAAYEKEDRRQLGNYDTPLYLARRILETIPIEQLPPHGRVIADVTCGWGSFLIAGYERIAALSESKEIPLQQYLHGNDVDPFFVQLARLGLMRATLRDDWNVDNQDVFEWAWLQNHQPDIIVGNPPFFGNRKEPSQVPQQAYAQKGKTTNQKRDEKANKFLEQAVERLKPGGYLALVMPRSFTISEAGPDTRKKLLDECDILELWDLPSEVFQGATVRTTVIFAQKKPIGDSGAKLPSCVRIRTVQPGTIEKFESAGTFTSSSIAIDQTAWYRTEWKDESKTITHVIDYKTILPELTWQTIRKQCFELQDCAASTRGITRGTKRKSYDIPSKVVHLLPNVKDTFPNPYTLNYTKAKELLYPDDSERPRLKYEYLFQSQKVLLQYVQTPSWGKRTKVAIERRGYYVSEHFYAIGIRENTLWRSDYTLTHEILSAILGWDVSNAWIIEHLKGPNILSYAVKTIPIPIELSKDDCKKLTEAVLALEKVANAGNSTSQETIEARNVIDRILQAAYHLDENTFKRLREVRFWEVEHYDTVDFQPEQTRASWQTSGIVDNVDASRGKITLWIDGFDELQQVNIVPSMPGWLLRPNATFLTKIPRESRRQKKIDPDMYDWGIFRPQPYMYMTNEDLLEGISQYFVAEPHQEIER